MLRNEQVLRTKNYISNKDKDTSRRPGEKEITKERQKD